MVTDTEPDMDHLCGSASDLTTKNGGYKKFLDRWNNDDKYNKSLSDIQYDEIALEDLSHVAIQQERSLNKKSWTHSLSAEGIQGPLTSAVTLKRRSRHAIRLYHEFTAITGSRNKLIPPAQQVRQA